MGGLDSLVVKVLDSQPRDNGFKSRHTLLLLCLKSLDEILPQMCLEVMVNMQLLPCRQPHKINPPSLKKKNAPRSTVVRASVRGAGGPKRKTRSI